MELLEGRRLLAGDLFASTSALADLPLASATTSGPVVSTERVDYQPGETAIITGTGFELGETVEFQVLHSAPVINKDSLVAEFDFNNGTASDSSNSSVDHSGSLVDDAIVVDGRLTLDGVGDYLHINDSSDINLGTQSQRTISLSFQATDTSGASEKQLLYKEGDSSRGLNIYLFDGRLYVGGWNQSDDESNWQSTYLSTELLDNDWHSVTLVLDGSSTLESNSLSGYLDGQLFGSGEGSQLWGHPGNVSLGAVDGSTRFHDGPAGLLSDSDGDSDTDGADFLAWQRGFGSTSATSQATGDANSSGNVDSSDLASWASEYGTTPQNTTAQHAFAGQIDDLRVFNRALTPEELVIPNNNGSGHVPWFVTDGGVGDLDEAVDGNILTTWLVSTDDSVGATFDLTASGQSSGLVAQSQFTDSVDLSGTLTTTFQSSGASDPYTFTHTVIAGNNRLLVVSVMNEGNESVSGITYGSTPLSFAVRQDAGGSSDTAVEIWYLVAPNVGANQTVEVSFNGSNGNSPVGVAATNFVGVDQTTPIGTTAGDDDSNGGNGGVIGVEITTTGTGSLIFGAAVLDEQNVSFSGGTATELWDFETGSTNDRDLSLWGGTLDAPTASTTYTLSTTRSNNDNDDWSIVAIEINMDPSIVGPPSVVAIDRNGSEATVDSSVSWTVTFNEPVTGVDSTDFALVPSGTLAGTSITSVTGSGATYVVTASTGTGNGTLGLNLADNDSILDVDQSLPLGGAGDNGDFTGEVYLIAHENPALPTDACSLDLVLVLDVSGSINGGEYDDMVGAMSAFVDAFDAFPASQFALVAYNGDAVVVQNFTADGSIVTSAMTSRPNPGDQYTNWDLGLYTARNLFAAQNALPGRDAIPDLIVFASDGNPNRIGGSTNGHSGELGHGGTITTASTANAAQAAIEESIAAKVDGIRIVTVGIGDNLTTSNLEAISGTNAAPPFALGTDIVLTSDFNKLADDLEAFAIALCPPAISLDKVGMLNLGVDGIANPGDVITYTFTIENTGDVVLDDVMLSDPLPGIVIGAISDSGNDNADVLEPGASETATGTYTITQADIDAGMVTNNATVTGMSPLDVTVNDTADDVVEIPTQNPLISIVKTGTFLDDINSDGFANVGEKISYTFAVTNEGNTTLNNVTVTDPLVTIVGGPTTLSVGETDSSTFTASYVINQDDINAGFVYNTATADSNESAPAEDSETTNLPQNAAIKIEKATNGQDADIPTGPMIAVGDTVTWTYVVTNTGNADLTTVSVGDSDANVTPERQADQVGNDDNVLDVGEIWVYEASAAAMAGQYMNTGSVSAYSLLQTQATASDMSNYFGLQENPPLPANACFLDMVVVLDVSGSINGVEYGDMVGAMTAFVDAFDPHEESQFALVAFNGDAVVVQNFTADGSIVTNAMTPRSDPGTQYTNWDLGLYTARNLFAAQNMLPGRDLIPDLIVFASDGNPNRIGGSTDGHTGVLGHSGTITTATEAEAVQAAVEEANQAKVDDIRIVTVAIGNNLTTSNLEAISGPNQGPPFALNTDIVVTSNFNDLADDLQAFALTLCPPAIELDKVGMLNLGVDGIANPGDEVTYTFTIENTGDIVLDNVMLTDMLDGIVIGSISDVGNDGANVLEPGAIETATGTYMITQADIDAGMVKNDATVKGTSPLDVTVDDTDDYVVDIPVFATIDIQKATNAVDPFNPTSAEDADDPMGPQVPVGSTVTFTYLVDNTGNVTLDDVVVTDDNGTPGDMGDDFNPAPVLNGVFNVGDTNMDNLLDVTETWLYQATATATLDQYTNEGSVTANAPEELELDPPTASDLSHYFGVLELIVIANDKGPGSKPLVTIIDATNASLPTKEFQFLAYEESYANGVRIAVGDLDGDGYDEIVTVPGAAHEARVKIFTRSDANDITSWYEADSFFAYDVSFDGGATVAIGDFVNNGDDNLDIVVTPSRFAVTTKIFANLGSLQFDTTPYKEFFAFGPSFIGGSVVSVANMDNTGADEVIVGSGTGIRATVNVWNIETTPTITQTFLPFADSFRGGVWLDVVDVNGSFDNTPDLIIGAGYRGLSAVQVWDGKTEARLTAFTAYTDSSNNSPVRVAGQDTDGDGDVDRILTVQGAQGANNEIRAFDIVLGDAEMLNEALDVAGLGDPDLFGAYFIDLLD